MSQCSVVPSPQRDTPTGVPLRVYWEQALELARLDQPDAATDPRHVFEIAAHLMLGASAAQERQRRLQHTQSTAHDLNNIAVAILGFSGMLVDDPLLAPHLRPIAEDLHHAGQRTQTLAQTLLHGQDTPSLTPAPRLPVAPIIDEAVAVARMHAPPAIRLLVEMDDPTLTTAGDATLLHAALVNVLLNAIHATMDTERQAHAPILLHAARAAWPAAVTPPPTPTALQLRVRDRGCGMDADTLRRARVPHFTTKAQRGGTGLGLVTVQRCADEAGGHLDITSTPGAGTTVTLWLPLRAAPTPPTSSPAVVEDVRR